MTDDPRVRVDRYIVYPTGYDELVHSDKDSWTLSVSDGHAWGWRVSAGMFDSPRAMNRKGQWVMERRGHKGNKARRYSLDEALQIALRYVDTHKVNGYTAAEASAWIAARTAEQNA